MKLHTSQKPIWLGIAIIIALFPSLTWSQNNINSLNAECGSNSYTTVNISWDKPANVDSFLIKDLFRNKIISKQNTNSIGFADLIPGSEYNLEITPICAGGCGGLLPDTIACNSTYCPNIYVNVDPITLEDPNITRLGASKLKYCLLNVNSNTIEFAAEVNGDNKDSEGTWVSNGSINEDGIFNVSESGQGIYEVKFVHRESEFCKYEDFYTIVVESLPPLEVDIPSISCVGSSTPVYVPQFLDDRIIPKWKIEGEHTLTDYGLDSIKIVWDNPGEFRVGMYIDGDINSCKRDTVWNTVKVVSKLSAPVVCQAYNDKIELSWESAECFETYQIILNGTSIDTVTDTEYIFDNLPEGHTINVQIVPTGANCICPITISNISCTTKVCDPIDLTVEGENFLCNETRSSINLNAIVNNTNGESAILEWNDDNISSDGTIDLASLPLGEHSFKLFTTLGDCNYIDSFELINTMSPELEIEFDGPSCIGQKGYLDLLIENYQEDFEIYIDDALVDYKARYSMDLTEHSIYVSDKYGCTSEELIFDLSTFESIEASFNQKDLVILEEDENIEYQIMLSKDDVVLDSVRWYYNDEMQCGGSNCDMYYNILPEDSGNLCAELFYDANCSEMICAEIRINKIFDFYIPNVIQIDANDPTNQSFTIFSEDDEMKVNSFVIFDKWGNRVFEKDPEEKSNNINWKGIFNGKVVDTGVFAYSGEIEFSDGLISRVTGNITILK